MEQGNELRTVLSIIIPVFSALIVAIFYLLKKTHDIELKMKDLEKKDELQQMVIDHIKKQLPLLIDLANEVKKRNNKK